MKNQLLYSPKKEYKISSETFDVKDPLRFSLSIQGYQLVHVVLLFLYSSVVLVIFDHISQKEGCKALLTLS